MLVRCYDTATQIFRLIDSFKLPSLEIETDALAALRRIRGGDTDFVFAHDGVEVPLHDIQTLAMIAVWQEPDHLTFLAA